MPAKLFDGLYDDYQRKEESFFFMPLVTDHDSEDKLRLAPAYFASLIL